jgi:hypothetical protein
MASLLCADQWRDDRRKSAVEALVMMEIEVPRRMPGSAMLENS